MGTFLETIEHIPEGRDWIRESARLLRPGGLFLVSTPNRRATNPGLYYEERPLNGYHHYEYSAEEFIGELLPFYDLLPPPLCPDRSAISSFRWRKSKHAAALDRSGRQEKVRIMNPLPVSPSFLDSSSGKTGILSASGVYFAFT